MSFPITGYNIRFILFTIPKFSDFIVIKTNKKAIKNQKKRSETNGCKLWLCCLCNSRADLIQIGQEINEMKEKLFF